MSIDIACPHCGMDYYDIPDQAIGKNTTCKKCGNRFQIVNPDDSYEEDDVEADVVEAGVRRHGTPPPLVNHKSSHLHNHNSQKKTSWLPIVIGCGCLMVIVPVLFISITLFIPGVVSAREAARRAQCENNLKQIGLGVHNYESSYEVFPAWALKDDASKPLLSWRVQLLPFMGQEELYKEFHLDEPWDSPHNLSLLPRMPEAYQCPSEDLEPGFTKYKVLVGENTMFPMSGPVSLRDVTDGSSNTMLVVESSVPVEWTKPGDILVDINSIDELEIGSRHPGGVNVLMADGAVKFIKSSVAPDTLKGLITRNGGEIISADSY